MNTPAPASRVRARLRDPRAAVALFFIILFALEGALDRFTNYGRGLRVRRDRALGYRLVPDQRVADAGAPIVINSAGYRDREWPPPTGRNGNEFRVALLGNSVTFALRVPIEESWGRALEAALQREFIQKGDGRKVVVMNFGVSGYVMEQMVELYGSDVAPHAPDLVIVGAFAADALPKDAGAGRRRRWIRELLLKSATFDFINRRMFGGTLAQFDGGEMETEAIVKERENHQILKRLSIEDPNSSRLDALWMALLDRADLLLRRVESDGGRLVIIGMPTYRSIYLPPRDRIGARFEKWLSTRTSITFVDPVPDLQAALPPGMDEFIKREVVTDAIRKNDIAEEFRSKIVGANAQFFLRDDPTHYAAGGHRIVGEAAACAIVNRGLAQPAAPR